MSTTVFGPKLTPAFTDYIKDKRVLVADTVAAARTRLAKTLIELGVSTRKIVITSSFETSVNEIKRFRPQILICDYDLGPHCGLELVKTLRQYAENAEHCLFLLVTADSSQSAVAQAAEADVDGYILKPYTPEQLKLAIIETSMEKMAPNAYMLAIRKGKEFLQSGESELAMEQFQLAMTLTPDASLACFYQGKTRFDQNQLDSAMTHFQDGLNYNRVHYKCLVGLYDTYLKKNQQTEAYSVVRKISQVFPSNPNRLAEVLKLAVRTKNYSDIEEYYQLFLLLNSWQPELVKHICAGMIICGKYYLQEAQPERALHAFQRAARTSMGRTKILREIVATLINKDRLDDANEFLKKFPSDTQNGTDFISMKYLLASRVVPPGVIIETGKKLIQNQIYDPMIFEVLLTSARKVGLKDLTEAIAYKAATVFPDKKAEYLARYIEN